MERDQTTNKSKKQYVFEEDTNNLNNSESQIKTAIFNVLFTLLKEQGISIYTLCVLVAIQLLQTLSLAFYGDLVSYFPFKSESFIDKSHVELQ